MKKKGLLGAIVLLTVVMLSGGTFSLHSTYSMDDAFSVIATDGYAYSLGVDHGDVISLTLADIDAPAYTDQITLNEGIRGCCLDGNYLYLRTYYGISIVDISNPSDLVNLYTDPSTTTYYGEDIAVKDGYAFSLNNIGLTIYDVSIPESSHIVNTSAISNTAREIQVMDSFLIISTNLGLRVYKISSDGDSASSVALRESSTSLQGLAVCGDYAYAARTGYGIAIFNISDPTNPTIVSYLNTAGWAYKIYYRNNFVYLAAETYLHAIDVTDRAYPVLSGSYATYGCYDVFGYGSNIFITEYSRGLSALSYSDDAYLPSDMAEDFVKDPSEENVCVEYFTGKIRITYTSKRNSDISVSLYDCSGRNLGVIYSGSVSGNGKVEAEAGGINKGTYFVKTKLGSDTYTEKVTLI